ncbi:hypothetical protein KC19_5G056400 [Ceratodon purpureus]|uniref:Uncharacterized protein n=1 Tax=Ceratodon purpureus TaxID=3225 RepID=A0A8T0HZN0_CERPU|nr:hypothetical protein KC19_5G056400 [Ceratodon purpureus]
MAMAAQALCYLDAKVQRNAEIIPRHPVSARSHTGMRLRRFSVNLERSDGLVISRSGFLGVGFVRGSSGDVVQRRKRRTPAASLREETNSGLVKEELPSEQYKQWDALTARIADSATVAFLLLQLPQIVLNTQNLVSGNHVALTAIPWMGQLTGLLGNLSLLSYFAGKKERGATVVQAVGVVSTGVVLSQLALGGAMPVPVFLGTACVVVLGLLLNWLSYFNKLSPGLWHLWGDAVTVGGLTVLPQVMWSTFVPYVPPSILPGSIFGGFALILVMLARLNKLPPAVLKFYAGLSAWTATLLFMWGPVAQAWSNYLNPANIKGLSVLTILLAMAGNGLLLPRALFTRDLMWFTGSSWGTLLQGWGILVTMFVFQVINDASFYGVSAVLALWLGWMLVNDAKAYSLPSPFVPLFELITGSRPT